MNKHKSYQWDALEYAEHSTTQQSQARGLIPKLKLKGDESLLDIGCGDGKVTAEIAMGLKNGNVLGIDNSAEMIFYAKTHFTKAQYPNLKFQRLDARKLLLKQNFDVVFSNAALHWVIDHRPVLKGIYSILKPHGRVYVQTGGRGNASEVIEVAEKMMRNEKWRRYFEDFSFPYGFYGPKEYEQWLKLAGLNVVRVELIHKERIHENMEKFKGWIRTTWLPYILRLPDAGREAFIDSLSLNFLQNYPPLKDGSIHTSLINLEFEATKS